jgi:hypothetical protein
MINGQTKSLGFILYKVLNNKIVSGLTYDDAAEYTIEFLRLVGAPMVYDNIVKDITINDFKGKLPTNIMNIRGVKLIKEGSETHLRYATDIYHKSIPCNDCAGNELTYEVKNGIIFTSFEKGTVSISYYGFMVDEEGYPLLPDNIKVLLGLEYYIIYRYMEGLWALGKIPDKVFNKYEQNKCWYLAAADSSLQMQNIDQLESTMNSLNRILYRVDGHKNGYRNFGKKEQIRKY